MYYLRSESGSNGLEAKKSHRFLAAGPFAFTDSQRLPEAAAESAHEPRGDSRVVLVEAAARVGVC